MNRTWKLGKGVPGGRIQTTEEEVALLAAVGACGGGIKLGRVGHDWPGGGSVS